ncbi:prepilin-type N-terminal cleavage/methylation domain-containing protein [Stieleria sp. TO1_6]|uniref:pilus assembly FimT family protein n=1 Tax=Stieleria tagensis TaxID=2956795 RepID=UPI00209ACA10|nr:prepilin-type N-terminal cleavage/methylation domain-containing protein [Stieleria tagensis]MCO8123646.1 prepilin-type N-terminal cleavage/methylation domain-containing protein [Stieleria tagensis]
MHKITHHSRKAHASTCTAHSRRGAFTLVELLIAITIASALTAIALPTLKDSMRQNTLSRCASLVKGAFINARSQAIRSGRPFGVVVERRRHEIGSGAADSLDFTVANYSTRLYYVQSPIEYRGDFDDAVLYPIFVDSDTTSDTDPVVPSFFVPQSSAGLLFAAANPNTGVGNSTAAKQLINLGTRFAVAGESYQFRITGLVQLTLTGTGLTNLGGNQVAYHPQIPAGAGVLVSFDYQDFSPQQPALPGILFNTQSPNPIPNPLPPGQTALQYACTLSTFPAGIAAYQSHKFKFRTNPIKAPLAPVNLIGKSIIDLSVSGTGTNPIAFNAQEIVDQLPATDIPPVDAGLSLNDVIVMFAADGKLDGVFYDQRSVTGGAGSARISGFAYQRFAPSASVSFNVGFIDGILDNVDDMARYPENVPGTDYQINPGDPGFVQPAPPAALVVSKVPNFANTDCAWVSVQPLSGNVRLEGVASQPAVSRLNSYYGFAPAAGSQTARNVVRSRMHQSRRLSSAGAVQ